jgi:dienelactone hydrolase
MLVLAPPSIAAQGADSSPLDGDHWGVVDTHPAMPQVRHLRNLPYLSDSLGTLTVDVYLPVTVTRDRPAPVVLFINGVGDSPGDRVKDWAIYRSWPRLLAAQGIIGVSMDADRDRIGASVDAALRWLRTAGPTYGIDPERIGIYAASANVRAASAAILGGEQVPGLRAAVLYYGGAPAEPPRSGLPVLFVVAESDHRPGTSAGYDSLWARVTAARAPWTLLFAAGLPHAFDAFDDSEASRRVVRQTIAFWQAHLGPLDPPLERQLARAAVAGMYWGGDTVRAFPPMARYLAAHPDDRAGWYQFGRMLRLSGLPDRADSALARATALGLDTHWLHLEVGSLRLTQRRWEEARTALRRVAASELESALVHGQIGWASLKLGDHQAAATSYERSFAIGIPAGRTTRGVAAYNLAIAYAHLGRRDEAFTRLDEAVAQGITARSQYADDEDLAPLRGDARFAALLARLQP